jgi:hypothetical protein
LVNNLPPHRQELFCKLECGFLWLTSRGRVAVSVDVDTSYLAFC